MTIENGKKASVFYTGFGSQGMYDLISSECPSDFELKTLTSDSDEERLEKIRDTDYVILFSRRLTEVFWEAGNRLKMIQFMGVGYHDIVDVEMLKRRGIRLGIAPAGTGAGVSEHAIMLMLAAGKRISFLDSEIRQGRWHANLLRDESRQLFNSTVGIVGLGRIGREVARRLSGFGVTILYHDIAQIDIEIERQLNVQRVGFDELLSRSDFVTLHIPLTEENHHLMNGETIARMKPGAILINTARGPIVEEAALVQALRSGHLGGAGLDVLEVEPVMHPTPLAQFRNVVLTPHHAPGTRDIMRMKARQVWQNIEKFHRGEPIEDLVV